MCCPSLRGELGLMTTRKFVLRISRWAPGARIAWRNEALGNTPELPTTWPRDLRCIIYIDKILDITHLSSFVHTAHKPIKNVMIFKFSTGILYYVPAQGEFIQTIGRG